MVVLVIGWFADWFGCWLLVAVVCFMGCCVCCFGYLFGLVNLFAVGGLVWYFVWLVVVLTRCIC